MTHHKPLVVLAAGGTAGHVYPALTVARALRSQHCDVMLCTDRRGVRFVSDTDIPYRVILSSAMQPGLIGKLKTMLKLGIGYAQSQLLFLCRKPSAIIGFGGYPSFPPVIAAAHRKVPVILHEQNAILGRAQRLLKRYATKICLSFPDTKMMDGIAADILSVTGLPLRPEVLSVADRIYTPPRDGEKFTILITGGSLASALFGRVIPQAMLLLSDTARQAIHIIQQCRADDIENVRKTYADNNISADVLSYINDMPDKLRAAHLFIGRAGASSVTEMAIASLPAIFIPLAVSLDGDQAANAANVINAGGGWILAEKDFSPESLAAILENIIQQPAQLTAMASTLKALGRPDATERLVQITLEAMS